MMGPEKKPITKLLIKSSYNLSSSVNLSKMPKSPPKKIPPSLKDKQATEKNVKIKIFIAFSNGLIPKTIVTS